MVEAILVVTANWTATNWIAFGAIVSSSVLSIISLLVSIYNNVVATRRERLKNRREEFHRRIATPLEQSLDSFLTMQDDIHGMLSASTVTEGEIEQVQLKAAATQRRLSRLLRFASESSMCDSLGWNLASDEYDLLVGALETARTASGVTRTHALKDAANAVERQDSTIRRKIEQELADYT